MLCRLPDMLEIFVKIFVYMVIFYIMNISATYHAHISFISKFSFFDKKTQKNACFSRRVGISVFYISKLGKLYPMSRTVSMYPEIFEEIFNFLRSRVIAFHNTSFALSS